MQILFAIAVLSCCALAWAAFSIAHHVRRSAEKAAMKTTTTFQQSMRLALERLGSSAVPVRRIRPHPREDFARGAIASFRPRNGMRVEKSIHTRKKKPTLPSRPDKRSASATGTNGAVDLLPVPPERMDRTYFNPGFGDLSDPDTHRPSSLQHRGSRAASTFSFD